jgi:hypothetical protein
VSKLLALKSNAQVWQAVSAIAIGYPSQRGRFRTLPDPFLKTSKPCHPEVFKSLIQNATFAFPLAWADHTRMKSPTSG